MIDYKEIIRKSEESYNRFFTDLRYIPADTDCNDITIDIENMQDMIQEKAKQAEAHIAYLNEVKHELEKTAAEKEAEIFKNEHKETVKHVNKMYDEYIEAQKKLFDLQVKLARKRHHE